jgi:hypothetical protein
MTNNAKKCHQHKIIKQIFHFTQRKIVAEAACDRDRTISRMLKDFAAKLYTTLFVQFCVDTPPELKSTYVL